VKSKKGVRMQPLKPIKITRSKEKITNRTGLPLIEELVEKLGLRERIV